MNQTKQKVTKVGKPTRPRTEAQAGRRRRRNAARRRRREAGGLPLAFATRVTLRSPLDRQDIRGSDLLTALTLPQTVTVSNAVVYNQQLSPSLFTATRQAILAKCYDKYRYARCALRYVPSVPMTVGGQIIIYFDLDPADDFTGATSVETVARDAMAHEGAVMVNVNQPATVQLPLRPGLRDFFTGPVVGDPKLFCQARIWVVAVAGLNGTGAPSTGVVGTLFMDYDLALEGPQLQETLEGAVDMSAVITRGFDLQSTGVNVTGGPTSVVPVSMIFQGVSVQANLVNLPDGVYYIAGPTGGSATVANVPFVALQAGFSSANYLAVVRNGVGLFFRPFNNLLYNPYQAGFFSASPTTFQAQESALNDVDKALLLNALSTPPVLTRVERLEADFVSRDEYMLLRSRLDMLEKRGRMTSTSESECSLEACDCTCPQNLLCGCGCCACINN